MRKFLIWLTGYLPCRLINEIEGDPLSKPYLQRYFLFSFLGFTGYIHRFVRSDPDRGMHCHPSSWSFSIILLGWYIEERFSGYPDDPYLLRAIKRFNFISGPIFHRVVLPQDAKPEYYNNTNFMRIVAKGTPVPECWTLFIHRENRVRHWGFIKKHPTENTMVYMPHAYTNNVKNLGKWWKTAPKGREIPNRNNV